MGTDKVEDKLSFRLMKMILSLIGESGANQEEALAALKASEALIVELDLSVKPTMTINS